MKPVAAFAFILLLGLMPACSSTSRGTLVILNKNDHNAMLVDLASLEIVATLPTGYAPHEATTSKDGRWVVVANYGTSARPGSTLTIIDVQRRKVQQTIALSEFRRPHGLATNAQTGQILVTAEAQQALLFIDLAQGVVSGHTLINQDLGHMVAATGDGLRAFVTSINDGSVTAVDLASGERLRTVNTGAGAESIAVSPDNQEVWIGNREDDTITILDVSTLDKLATLPSAEFPIRVKITPDGRYALVSNMESGDVTVFDAATRKEVTRIDLNAPLPGERPGGSFAPLDGRRPMPIGLLIHPDGDVFYVATPNVNRVMIVEIGSWRVTGRITTGDTPDGLAWSPY